VKIDENDMYSGASFEKNIHWKALQNYVKQHPGIALPSFLLFF